ncbi:hypothetical protein [Actinoplanes sp. N902-109]|uniref:hypothetical protein n=1 Tax=Actinoplanes sp. (strain N902-109) TaxID=649831 RepID=UPI00032939AC|nr:hypothetical protein [Actinoplanes sp. N902-109]AGL15665.1 hypothetical protein L083_2155 [Actinoplanes sp. N902-109]
MSVVEQRLRGALQARAQQVTADRLRPAQPPTLRPVRRPWRWVVAVSVTLAVVALVLVLRPAPVRDQQPDLPAGPAPSVVSPATGAPRPTSSIRGTPEPSPSASMSP